MNSLPMRSVMQFTLFFLLLVFVQLAVGAEVSPESGTAPAGLSTGEALRLGEAMYRKGTLPSGEPITGFVQGDIEVKGQMLTCANCHMRSGLGSYKGGVTALPINGPILFSPLQNGYDLPSTSMGIMPFKAPRPAYSNATLAEAVRHGVDSSGRSLSWTMPRYILNDREMEIMIFYLRNLSAAYSPGATKDILRLATVVSEGISPGDRKSMLEPMRSFIEHFPRKLRLDVWELQGPENTWKEQLEKQYQQQPVFALMGGMVKGSWGPLHEFCEKNSIPCILPITDLPTIAENDRQTLYFSKGYAQEGEAAAQYLAHGLELPSDKPIVQVFRENNEGRALSQGFADSWKKFGGTALINRIISAGETTGVDFWKQLAATHRDTVLLLWLGPDDLAGIELLGELQEKPFMVFASSTMVGEALSFIPDKIRNFTWITYPYGLPEERELVRAAVDQFWRSRAVYPTNKIISAKVYSLISLLSQAFGALKNNRYRDYFFDLFDTLEDQTGTSVLYPRLSFGPGQRYASKGCYIVMLAEGQPLKLIKKSEWVIF